MSSSLTAASRKDRQHARTASPILSDKLAMKHSQPKKPSRLSKSMSCSLNADYGALDIALQGHGIDSTSRIVANSSTWPSTELFHMDRQKKAPTCAA